MDPRPMWQPYQAGGSNTVDSAAAGDYDMKGIREEKKRVKREKDIERSRQYREKEKEIKALLQEQNTWLRNQLNEQVGLWNQLNEKAQNSSIVIAMLEEKIVHLNEQIIEQERFIELLMKGVQDLFLLASNFL